MQLYAFGLLFGFVSLCAEPNFCFTNVFDGFNLFAYATIAVWAACGLLISFILKYVDSVVKCFGAAASMLCVAILDAVMKR